jgi:hypothetical protein
MLSDRDAVCTGGPVSVTWIVKFDVPSVVGVPVISAVAGLKDKPAGRLPDEGVQI